MPCICVRVCFVSLLRRAWSKPLISEGLQHNKGDFINCQNAALEDIHLICVTHCWSVKLAVAKHSVALFVLCLTLFMLVFHLMCLWENFIVRQFNLCFKLNFFKKIKTIKKKIPQPKFDRYFCLNYWLLATYPLLTWRFSTPCWATLFSVQLMFNSWRRNPSQAQLIRDCLRSHFHSDKHH